MHKNETVMRMAQDCKWVRAYVTCDYCEDKLSKRECMIKYKSVLAKGDYGMFLHLSCAAELGIVW